MGVYLSSPKTHKKSKDGGNGRLGFGSSSMQGWRSTMEDAHAALPDLDSCTSYFGVYDGHGGKVVAKFCAKHLHKQMIMNKAYSSGDLGTSIRMAFFRMDEMMIGQRGWRELAVLGNKINKFSCKIEGLIYTPRSGASQNQTDEWASEDGPHADFSGPTSGCTACVAIIRNNQLIIANAGDSRCVISRKGKAYNLSTDHKPEQELERERIVKAGGFVRAGRINGRLNLSRAIGDKDFKQNKLLLSFFLLLFLPIFPLSVLVFLLSLSLSLSHAVTRTHTLSLPVKKRDPVAFCSFLFMSCSNLFEIPRCSGRDGPDESYYAEVDPTGRYGRFDQVLGKGAMKTVYRAFDEVNGIEVAWNQARVSNVLRSPLALEHLYSEVNLLSILKHDSIMQFHSTWTDPVKGTFNFITEMFTSGSLREYRQKYKRVSIKAVKNWARQILHGLVYLHEHNPPVIHRDLKCDNIFVNGNLGQVKIGDLGLAAFLRNSQPAHSVIGTPEFMAPELYEEEYNELVDIYSFGMCVLEMLTSEYPYSECSNPAQIYKKVTTGKLPSAFYKIQDEESRIFIGRCLVSASRRSSAKDLLLDPFLQDQNSNRQNSLAVSHSLVSDQEDHQEQGVINTGMKITGKMNPDDDAIFLRVHFADKTGHTRNIYFPFDIIQDTPIDVADEMVKELDILDHDPSHIAEMIDVEISALVPDWKDRGKHNTNGFSDDDYDDEDDEDSNIHPGGDNDASSHHHFFYISSSASSHSSGVSQQAYTHSTTHGSHLSADHLEECIQARKIFHGEDHEGKNHEDVTSQNSIYYEKRSDANSNTRRNVVGTESSRRRDHLQPTSHNQKVTRFGPEENTHNNHAKHADSYSTEEGSEHSHSKNRRSKKASARGELARNQSLVDIRSQFLHRTIVEEVNKRMFNSVGSVEDIGYQNPCQTSSVGSAKRDSCRLGKKNVGLTWGTSQ